MSLRTGIVGVILTLLAGVAAAAIAVALTQRWEAFFRIVVIGVIGGTAGLLAIPLAMLTARPALRLAAATMIGSLVVVALLLCLAVLEVGGFDEQFAITAGALAGPLLLLVAAALLVPSPRNRTLGVTGAVVAAVSVVCVLPFLAMLFGMLSPSAHWTEPLLVAGQLLVPGCLLVFAACWRREAERPDLRPGLLAGAPAIVALVASLIMIHADYRQVWQPIDDRIATLLPLLWSTAAGFGIWRLMRLAELRGLQQVIRWGFLLTAIAGGASLVLEEVFSRGRNTVLGAAVLVLSGCLMIAAVLIGWLNRRTDYADRFATLPPGRIDCPRCGEQIGLTPGSGACAACGLRYKLSLEAPRCRRCREDLSARVSDCCPECGESIRGSA